MTARSECQGSWRAAGSWLLRPGRRAEQPWSTASAGPFSGSSPSEHAHGQHRQFVPDWRPRHGKAQA
eukprot:985351-Alexandrium_andersonii.AAC.1